MAADREIAFISGELKTKQESLAGVQQEMNSTIYHDIDKRYRDSLIAHSGAQLGAICYVKLVSSFVDVVVLASIMGACAVRVFLLPQSRIR